MDAVFTNHKGWLNGVLRYKYNGEGKPDSAFLTRNGKAISTIDYTYDSAGNLTQEHWNFNGKWQQEFRYFYEPENHNHNIYSSPWLCNSGEARIIREDYSYNGTIGGPSSYIYDTDGLLTKKIFTRSDGFSTTSYYAYGKSGILESSERISGNGEKTRFTYVYDEGGHLILRNYFVKDTLAGFEVYRYSSSGELVSGEVKNMDDWLTGSIVFFTGTHGQLIKAVFTGEKNRKADIHFESDKYGLMKRIRWNFSDGTWQEYLFSYSLESL